MALRLDLDDETADIGDGRRSRGGFEKHHRPIWQDVFLAKMEQIVPWAQLYAVIEPHYPRPGKGRPPVGLERMLQMYFVQRWFNLADEACEEALPDNTALRRFVGIDLGRGTGCDDAAEVPPPTCSTNWGRNCSCGATPNWRRRG